MAFAPGRHPQFIVQAKGKFFSGHLVHSGAALCTQRRAIIPARHQNGGVPSTVESREAEKKIIIPNHREIGE